MPVGQTRQNSSGVLPLSTFQTASFSPTTLLLNTESVSHSDMLKLIHEYEQSVRSELVALVNDNCRDFLEVSSVMNELTKKLVNLKDPLVLKYKSSASFADFVRQLTATIRNSDKLKAELVELEQTKFDMREISDIVESLIDTDRILTDVGELDPDSLRVISQEMSRCFAMVSALDSVIAETGVSSALLRELVPKLRAEHSRIKLTRLIPRIANELVVCFSKLSDTTADHSTILRSISVLADLLESREKFYNLVRENILGDSIRLSPQEPFTKYLDRLRTTWMTPTSILSVLSDRDPSIFPQVLLQSFSDELLRRTDRSTQVTLFVPTSATLDVWYNNYTESEKFISSLIPMTTAKIISEYRSKWKLQIYVSLCMKQLAQQVLASPLTDRPRVLLEQSAVFIPRLTSLGPQQIPRLIESLVELFDSLSQAVDQDKITLYFFYQEICTVFSELKSCFPKSIHSMLGNEEKIFRKKSDGILLATVTEIATPMSQTYDSVKQVSALYRVASNRGLPTRHSVYVDLAIKPLQTFRDSYKDERSELFGKTVESIVAQTVEKSYMQSITDLMAKEQSRGGKEELEKISAQILLDMKRTEELLSPNITSEFKSFIAKFANKYNK